jgi:hypothetical protein
MHNIEFRQIMRDAEIAHAISPVVRQHRLTQETTEKVLLELGIPRAANIAEISVSLALLSFSGSGITPVVRVAAG